MSHEILHPKHWKPALGYANRQAEHAGPATQAAEQGLRGSLYLYAR